MKLGYIGIHQIGLVTSLKGSDFIFDCVYLLYYQCHKINLNPGGSYRDSSDWIKNKNATINSVNDYHKSFKYAATVTLNHKINWKISEEYQI